MMDRVPDRAAGAGLQRAIGRGGFLLAVIGLGAGSALFLLHQAALATPVFAATFAVLITLPFVNVVGVLVEEVRRRDWFFAGLAAAVLALLLYSVIDRLAGA